MDLSWYENNIEPEVREAVFILRNAGFNTLGSCGHDGWITVMCEYDNSIYRITDLLNQNGFSNFRINLIDNGFCLEIWLDVINNGNP